MLHDDRPADGREGAAMMREVLLRAFQSAPDATIVVDSQGIIMLANSAAELMFGYSGSEMVGRPVEMLVPKELRLRHEVDRSAYHAAPEARPMGEGVDLTAVRKDGSVIPVEISLSPATLEGGVWSIVIASIRDITRRRELELAFHHRLRTPLNEMIGLARMLAEGRGDSAKTAQAIESAAQQLLERIEH